MLSTVEQVTLCYSQAHLYSLWVGHRDREHPDQNLFLEVIWVWLCRYLLLLLGTVDFAIFFGRGEVNDYGLSVRVEQLRSCLGTKGLLLGVIVQRDMYRFVVVSDLAGRIDHVNRRIDLPVETEV